MIEIRNLKKSYPGITPLKDCNATIQKGDIISIIGPSGTGKSTLLRCINLLERPDRGNIFIDGQDIMDRKTDISKVRKKIGMVFQNFHLFSHKMVIENIMMAPMDLLGVSKQEAFDNAIHYLKMVGLKEKMYAYPDELSGGQKQRVAIARCLAMKPEIILFDEPTSALDPLMVSEVRSVIYDLAKQGLTMMVVTHDMQLCKDISTRIFYMDEGIVYETGSPEEIFEHPKKEKTKAFVKRLKTWRYSISSVDFDLYEMNAQIEDFARKHSLSNKRKDTLLLVIEELIMHSLLPHTSEIEIEVGYFEADNSIEVSLSYGGEAYDPFNNDEEDVLSMLLVRQFSKNISYKYDSRNHCIFFVQ